MAVENEVQNAELAYLLFPFEQYANLNGKPLVGGHIEVYQAGTDTKYITYQDWDGDVNPFKIPIPADGRIVALADPSLTYDVYVYDSFNNLVCSRLNIQCNVPGEINLSGVDTYVRNTDGTLDVSLQTSGNNRRVFTVNTKNKLLDVQEPLYFVENSETATIIGFDESGNYATTAYVGDAIASSISSKVDITAFNEEITNITNNITALSADVDGKMDVSKLEYNSHDEISGYDGSAFAGGQGDPEVNELVHANSAVWNEVSAKADASALTAYQTIEGMTAYQPSGDYATHDDLTAYQPSGDYATHDDLSAYQPSGDYAYASAVSAAITGLQSANNISISSEGALIAATLTASALVRNNSDIYVDNYSHISAYTDGRITVYNGGIVDIKENSNIHLEHACGISGNENGVSAKDWITTGGIRLSDMTAYQPTSSMTAYQPTGDYATNTDLQAVSAEVSGKQDKLTIWPVAAGDNIKIEESGNQIVISTNLTGTDYVERDELSAYQTTADMSAYQPSGDYADASALDGKVDTSSFSSFSSTTNEHIEYISAALSGEYELSAGSGIDITDYPNEQKTVISVTAQGPNQEVEAEVIAHSADWNTVTAKADSDDLTAYQTIADMTAYQPVGDYYSASNPDGFLVADDITGKMDTSAMTAYQPAGEYLSANALDNLSGTWETVTAKANADDLTAYQTIEGMTAYQPSGDYQPAGEYLSANALDNVSADWNEVSAKLDTTAFSDVSGSFLTAHQDISNKLDTTAFSDVSGSFLTAVPDTYLQNTDLATADGKVTAISGIPLSAGGDVPEGVMVESGLDYDSSFISGYSGSAFKDVALTDVVTANSGTWGGSALPISAGPGVKVDLQNNTLVFSTDETVLWSGNSTGANPTFDLSGNISDFEYIEFYAVDVDGWCGYSKTQSEYCTTANRIPVVTQHYGVQTKNIIMRGIYVHPTSDTHLDAKAFGFDYNGTATENSNMSMKRIVGINRVAGGN